MLVVCDLSRHIQLGIVNSWLIDGGGAHAVPRHTAGQAQGPRGAQHGAAGRPVAGLQLHAAGQVEVAAAGESVLLTQVLHCREEKFST